jgi:hypothetical protein
LEACHLVLADWSDHLRRELIAERVPFEPAALAELPEPSDGELARVAAVDALCGGFLEQELRALATDTALAGVRDSGSGERRQLLAATIARAAAAREEIQAVGDVEREIGARSLEWTRIDADVLELADHDAAQEVAACVRVDGRPLAEVAADAGGRLERRSLYLEDAEREGLTVLLGALGGELVGPLRQGERSLLLEVQARVAPTSADELLSARARDYLLELAIASALEQHVRWA